MASRDTGKLKVEPREKFPLPPPGGKRVYIITSAQNNTQLNLQCWNNLLALAAHDNAEIIVGAFTYNIPAGAKGEKKSSAERVKEEYVEWWVSELEPYMVNRSVEVAPGLIWCGEVQILPTAANPLSGFESYTGRSSSIIPHTKFAVQSIPSPKHAGTKFLYTTGTVTLRNYVKKKAGLKAEFHHGYGGLIVEVDSDGNWFVRQLNADSEGVIYDLDRRVDCGIVTTGHSPEAIVWGDIHVRQLDPAMYSLCWGPDGIVQALSPRRQVLHDVLDFRSQNHHDRKDPWKNYAKFVESGLNVEVEIQEAAKFLFDASRGVKETAMVCSNHDMALVRWLKEGDHKTDPMNAPFYLRANLAAYEAMRRGDKDFYPVEWAFRKGTRLAYDGKVKFLRQDEEYIVCPDANGGIELGMHGDKGPNGARGSLAAFARTGRKSIIGHGHGAGLIDGAMQVGVMASLDMGYNEGPSNWSHTFALVYPSGKRTLVTIWKGKYHA